MSEVWSTAKLALMSMSWYVCLVVWGCVVVNEIFEVGLCVVAAV